MIKILLVTIICRSVQVVCKVFADSYCHNNNNYQICYFRLKIRYTKLHSDLWKEFQLSISKISQ